MTKLLITLVPFIVVVPHLVPLPDRIVGETKPVPEVKADDKALPKPERMAKLAEDDPVAFLEACAQRHAREVKGYTVTFHKQERINGNLEKKEVIDAFLREEPFSVLFRWKEGTRLCSRALYVEGEFKDEDTGKSQVVIKPAGFAGRLIKSVLKDPNGTDAQKSGRYPISEFGLKKGLERTLNAWKEAKDKKDLYVEYLGKKKIEMLDNRECYILKRSKFTEPDGLTEQTAYIDAETWLMIGSTLKNKDGGLVAEYLFKDVKLNPTFEKDLFTKKSIEN